MLGRTPSRPFHSPSGPKAIFLLGLLVLLAACGAPPGENGASHSTPQSLGSSPQPTRPGAIAGMQPSTAPRPTVDPTWTIAPSPVPTNTPPASPTPACQESSQVLQGRFPSALAWPDLAYRIFLPPCYGQDSHVYPVLYMLPGNIHDDSIWDRLGLDEAADAGIRDGLLPPLLIVMPDGGSITEETSGGAYSYEGVIVNELRPFIEANYCAWSEPAGRAIGGLSRGGYWSLEIAFRNPALFASVGGHSAALLDSYAGPDLDPTYTALSADLSSLRIYLDAGQNDWYLGRLQRLHDNLLTAGKEHAWVVQEGGHEEAYWAAHVADYLAWYAEPWHSDRRQLPQCEISSSG